MEFPAHPLFVSLLLMLTLLLGVFLWPEEEGDSMLSLTSQGNMVTMKHIWKMPSPAQLSDVVYPTLRLIHIQNFLFEIKPPSLPPQERWSPLSGRCPVPPGGFWNVQFCWGNPITSLWSGKFQPLEDFWVRRNTQTWENLEHTPRECWAPCVLPKAIQNFLFSKSQT